MQEYFGKKVFTFRILVKDSIFLFSSIFKLSKLKKNKDISDSFREKIMTIVSSVNGCVYCKWFHAKQSVKAGIAAAEVKNLMELQFKTTATDFELNALVFAQHYAETNRKPDQEMIQSLNEFYGDQTASHIILAIRMIFYGNLYGNTLDAFVSRINGKKAENSNLIFELWFFFNNIPTYVALKLLSGK